ncbi:MAG: hypothetical protein B7733_23390 [Myxococcales bacterium FL481]|nr:MAG: hypothetical protein B7733_23390 [Myxococcales bacterium FL481]
MPSKLSAARAPLDSASELPGGPLDWLIIGGGLHGVHLAARLLGEAQVSPQRLRIVDPGARLLARWRSATATTGMTHLRSPSVHHLDLSPWSLRRFAGQSPRGGPRSFAPPYDRPALVLFNAHCDQVVADFELSALHVRARASACSIGPKSAGVELSNGTKLETRNVVLAIGASEQPAWPDWAPRGRSEVQHVFMSEFDGWPSSPETVVVVGGGISASQVALRLIKEGHEVHLVSRHALRQHQFDSDPGWLGPRFMTGFRREPDLDRRRAMIAAARHRGSVPPDVRRTLRRALARKPLHWHESEVASLDLQPEGLELRLGDGARLQAQRLLLATGFDSRRPGGSMVDALIESASLPCASCGYPLVDTSLRWHPRVWVAGPLAELELGPTARNIAGARRAGDRLVHSARTEA